MSKPVVLFLCVGNSARSQMAEAFLRRDAGDYFDVHSAGMEPQTAIHPMTYQVMAEKGLDLARHTPKHLRQFLGHAAIQHLITVCEPADAKCPTVWPGVVKRHNWPFDDPATFVGMPEERLQRFREVRDQIEAKVRSCLEEMAGQKLFS